MVSFQIHFNLLNGVKKTLIETMASAVFTLGPSEAALGSRPILNIICLALHKVKIGKWLEPFFTG